MSSPMGTEEPQHRFTVTPKTKEKMVHQCVHRAGPETSLVVYKGNRRPDVQADQDMMTPEFRLELIEGQNHHHLQAVDVPT